MFFLKRGDRFQIDVSFEFSFMLIRWTKKQKYFLNLKPDRSQEDAETGRWIAECSSK